MDMQTLLELLQALRVELSRHRVLATFIGCLVLLAVLVMGYFMPSSYYTDTVLYVDQSNILEPLLEGQAEVQQVNQVEEVKEKIYTRRILESVAIQAGLLKEGAAPAEVAKILKALREGAEGYDTGLQVQNRGNNYIGISYSHPEQDVSYKVIDAVVAEFINDIAETKRSESRRAFEFIDGQVKAYKKQLQAAEDRLKDFRTINKDGTSESVNRRIEQLRRDTEELRLEINEQRARRASLNAQLENETEFLNVRSKANVYRERIREAQVQIDNLLLTYTETYPDVVALRLQIEDHKNAIAQVERRERGANSPATDDASLNPLYEDLRRDLANTNVELRTAQQRLRSLEQLLEEEYARSERVAASQADLTELTRDYNVTRSIYEDMLSRKEKARLSMTLDIEGQGVTYRVQEPPVYPIEPKGLRFQHFAIAAPVLGLLAPIGLFGFYLLVDPRVRTPSLLSALDDVELLVTIPTQRIKHSLAVNLKDLLLCGFLIAATLAAYVSVTIYRLMSVGAL